MKKKRNIHFLWNTTHIDRATLTASAEAPGWPVQNLQNPQILKAWKCPEKGGWVRVSFDRSQMMTALVLVGHNLGVDARVRVTFYDDNFITPAYTQEEEVIKQVYTAEELMPCNSDPFGYPSDDDLEILPRTNVVMLLDESQCCEHVHVDIISDSEFQIGRLILCEHWEPEVNFDLGWDDCPVDDSTCQTSIGGQEWVDLKSVRYGFNFTLSNLLENEVTGPLMKMRHFCKKSVPLVVMLMPDDPVFGQYTSVHCKFTSMPRVTHTAWNKFTCSMSIREVL